MASLGKAESPVVERTFQRRQALTTSRSKLNWAFINGILLVLVIFEMRFCGYMSSITILSPILHYAEICLACVFCFNAVVDLLVYFGYCISSGVVEINAYQKKLLGVKDTEQGFKKRKPGTGQNGKSPGLVLSPSTYTGHQSPAAFCSAPRSLQNSYLGSPQYSPQGSLSPSPRAHRSATPGILGQSLGQSASYHQANLSPSQSATGSFLGISGLFNQSAFSPLSASLNASVTSPLSNASTLFHNDTLDTSGLRNRLHSPAGGSFSNSPDCITDHQELHTFIKQQEEKQMRLSLGSPDTSTGTGPSFWNYNRSVSDYSPLMRKYQYQIACRTPTSTKSKDDDNDDGPAQYEAERVWTQIGVHIDIVDKWVERLRKWLGQTIMARLVEQIETINKTLVRIGCEDMEVGEVSISVLKQLSMKKGDLESSMDTLIPFLEVTPNQEYLVGRIKELGKGGCMSDFKWNGGGMFKGKPWSDQLPTDAMIVMHALCTYMDFRLPSHLKYPDGKTFTSQHFIKTPDKPNLEKEDNLLIYQTKINPPHYKVVIGNDTWNLSKGRNNMFHAILLFLHHIKEKEHGMLGRVNLGLSGVNVLWVLDS